MEKHSNNYVAIWLKISLIILILMVLLGGITRLTDSGLSITNWKPFIGILPPLNEQEWSDTFNEYKKYQEYQIYNKDMILKDYKYIYFWEYSHRMLGRFIGLLFLIPSLFFYFKKYLNRFLIKKLSYLFLLGILQAFVGWYMVKSGLVDRPDISHYRLAIHLFLAFIIIGFVYSILLDVEKTKRLKLNNKILYYHFLNVLFVFFFLQIIYGAFNAALKTSHFWNTFPLIDNQIIPHNLFILTPFWVNIFANPIFIQFIHRYLGIIILILVYVFCYKIHIGFSITDKIKNLHFLKIYKNLLIAVTCQFFLGIITLVSGSSIVLTLSHQIVAILLFLMMIKIRHYLKN